MATLAVSRATTIDARLIATFPGLRVLAWDGHTIYASRGYDLLAGRTSGSRFAWEKIASFSPQFLRRISCRFALTARLARDGFHALAILRGGNIVAAVPGAIITLKAGEAAFVVTQRISRGTRPLHFASAPDGLAVWGEYFDNRERAEVSIFASVNGGETWEIAHTFPRGAIRHVHNIVYDEWERCFWVLTGDEGRECKILRASTDLKFWDEVVSGNQQSRAVAAIVTREGLYFATDTPLENNFIYFLDRGGRAHKVAAISSSSIHGCKNRNGMFFSTMVEPSAVNLSRDTMLIGSADGAGWAEIARWQKDRWPMRLLQYGNVILPDGDNSTDLLAATTVAVESADMQTTIWRTSART